MFNDASRFNKTFERTFGSKGDYNFISPSREPRSYLSVPLRALRALRALRLVRLQKGLRAPHRAATLGIGGRSLAFVSIGIPTSPRVEFGISRGGGAASTGAPEAGRVVNVVAVAGSPSRLLRLLQRHREAVDYTETAS